MTHILITGASSGIGEALAIHYSKPDVTISICGRNEERLNKVAAKCRILGATIHTKIINVADKPAMQKWMLECDAREALDLIIANAGVSGSAGDFKNADDLFAVNMNGVCNTIHPILPTMIERGHGQIAMLSSLAGYRGLPSAPAYSASKCFVKAYAEALRGQIRLSGVKINVICPGFVKSRITDQNNFKMPGFMQADSAAKLIANGLRKNKPVIAFPSTMVFGAWFLSILPSFLFQWVADKLPNK